jgi:PAS domain S-box-containing protein
MRGRYGMKVKSRSRQPDKKNKQSVGAFPWSEKAFRELADNIIDGVYCINSDGYFTFVNGTITRRYGISPDKFHITHFLDVVHPQYRDLVSKNFQRVINGEDGIPYELRHEDADGQLRISEVLSRPVRIDGKVVGIVGISRDITERKRAEETLKDSEELFSVAFHVNPAPMIISTIDDGVILDVNDRWLSMLGYARDEMIGHETIRLPIWMGYEARASFIRKFLKERLLRGELVQLRTKSGEIRDTLWSAEPVRYRGREVVLSLLYDITDRKMAEQALQESERKYRLIFENAVEGIYQVSPEGRFMSANPAAARIHGYESSEELIDTIKDIGSQIYAYPEDRDKAIGLMREQGFIKDFEVRCRHKNGSIVWVSFNAKLVRDDQGNILCYEGTSQDITDRKRAEDELAKYRESLEQLVAERTLGLEDKTKALEELNISLKVLLRHREEDKKELEDRFRMNIKKLIMPFAEKMKRTHLDERQLAYLSIIEKHLNDITSSLTKNMHQFNFTPTEVKVASLLNDGKTTKEIAKIIGIATSSIDTHRNHIRKKLGIIKKKVNLRSHLQSFD